MTYLVLVGGQEGELDGAAFLSFIGEEAEAQKVQRDLCNARWGLRASLALCIY